MIYTTKEFLLIWLLCGVLSAIFVYMSFMNKFGWNERILSDCCPSYSLILALSIFGGILNLLAILAIMNKYCFMSKEKALYLYDKKDHKRFGYFIGREIACDENRFSDIKDE